MILYFRGDILPDLLRSHLEQAGNIVHIYDSEEIKRQDSKPSQDEEAIFKANLSLRQRVIESIMTNAKTLNIGGDHTMGMKTVSAFLECFAKSKKVVICMDRCTRRCKHLRSIGIWSLSWNACSVPTRVEERRQVSYQSAIESRRIDLCGAERC
jgi:hypothetical protein